MILRDKDLVRTFLAQRRRPPIFGWFVTLLLGFITLALLVMAGVSLATNRQMLAEAKDKGEKMLTIVHSDAGKNTLDKKEDEVRRELNATDDLRTLLVKLDDYDRNGPPLYMRFGLYSGRRVYKQQLLPIYMGVVEQRFKAPTVKRVETELRKFAASQPVVNAAQLTDQEEQNLGKNYDLLKAYLMLSGNYKDKAEATHLANTLKDYWISESKIPADLNLTAQAQLDFWAKQVDRDDADYRFPRINPDAKLVDDVRKKLQAYPAWQRYYKRKVTEISKQIDDTIGATTATGILTRNGGDTSLIEGTYTVPSAFTKPAYELMKTAIADADQKLSEDDWVMGETGKNAVAQSTDASKIEDRYYRDYADHWRNFVKGVAVKPYKNKDDAANALQTFSSSNSPMKILLTEIAKNTNLSAPPENPGLWGWIKSWFQSKTSSDTGGNTEVEKQFRPLFTFVGTKDQKDTAPIEKYQTEIGNVYKDFNGISQDRLKAIGQQMANDEDPIKLRVRETSISNLIKGFSETPSAQEIATLLQKPLGNLRTLLGAGEKDRLAKAWTEQIMPAAKEVEKGFPFDDSAGESDLTKLTAYLNPNDGKLSKFYKDGLEKYFEESNGQLKVKDTSDIKFTDEFVAYLNAAFSLRKALFGTERNAEIRIRIQLPAGQGCADRGNYRRPEGHVRRYRRNEGHVPGRGFHGNRRDNEICLNRRNDFDGRGSAGSEQQYVKIPTRIGRSGANLRRNLGTFQICRSRQAPETGGRRVSVVIQSRWKGRVGDDKTEWWRPFRQDGLPAIPGAAELREAIAKVFCGFSCNKRRITRLVLIYDDVCPLCRRCAGILTAYE